MKKTFLSRWSMISAFILDLLFPTRCPICGEIVNWRIQCCDECLSDICYTGKELCHGCGNHSAECECGSKKQFIDGYYIATYYLDAARSAIIYNKEIPDGFFPHLAAKKIAPELGMKIDCIVPVPMGRIKQRKRGYNQAELFTDALSEELGLPVIKNALIKRDTLIAQHNRSATGREASVDETYFVGNAEEICGKIVLLCDDVITTGSTVNKCAEILLKMGAKKVYAAAEATVVENKSLIE